MQKQSLPNLKIILQFILAIPGTNSPVEHVFSLMNVIGQLKKLIKSCYTSESLN